MRPWHVHSYGCLPVPSEQILIDREKLIIARRQSDPLPIGSEFRMPFLLGGLVARRRTGSSLGRLSLLRHTVSIGGGHVTGEGTMKLDFRIISSFFDRPLAHLFRSIEVLDSVPIQCRG
jgi:hypothetical protein